mmetsp:Transcript_12132/g.51057  ORF Transcript_12132/g.51057 Transcript_12132/m.51057 type:complete len:289 (-) Transcript_12132:104-970(-)
MVVWRLFDHVSRAVAADGEDDAFQRMCTHEVGRRSHASPISSSLSAALAPPAPACSVSARDSRAPSRSMKPFLRSDLSTACCMSSRKTMSHPCEDTPLGTHIPGGAPASAAAADASVSKAPSASRSVIRLRTICSRTVDGTDAYRSSCGRFSPACGASPGPWSALVAATLVLVLAPAGPPADVETAHGFAGRGSYSVSCLASAASRVRCLFRMCIRLSSLARPVSTSCSSVRDVDASCGVASRAPAPAEAPSGPAPFSMLLLRGARPIGISASTPPFGRAGSASLPSA